MRHVCYLLMLSLATVGISCQSSSNSSVQSTAPASRPDVFLKQQPASPVSVIAAKEKSKDGDEITIDGRIGGSQSPFVAGRAAFTIVDTSLIPCSEREGDLCPSPWDYCCDLADLPAATAVVKLVDENGQTLALDAKSGLGLKELQTVVLQGKAKRDETGNLTVLAQKIFVK